MRPPAGAEPGGHLRERDAGGEQLGADQVGAEVAVTEAEPGGLGAVRPQLLDRAPALVDATPAALGVATAAEGVHERVQVRAHAEAVDRDVVGRVPDIVTVASG